MHDRAIIALLALSNVALFGTTVTFVGLWIRARERAIRATVDTKRHVQEASPDIEHLMNAVDSIAVEVERISEAQRFTTKVLVDRVENGGVAKRQPERIITPH